MNTKSLCTGPVKQTCVSYTKLQEIFMQRQNHTKYKPQVLLQEVSQYEKTSFHFFDLKNEHITRNILSSSFSNAPEQSLPS